jgi:hypothetical protein
MVGRKTIVRKKGFSMISASLAAIMILALVGPSMAPAAAQDASTLVVWYTIEDIGPVLDRVGADFAAEFPAADVVAEYVRPQQLFDSMARAGGSGPDVILASSSDIGPLVDRELVVSGGATQAFFLADVLDRLPDLIDAACPDADVADCLWPRVSPTLDVTLPDARLMTRTEGWLCSSADWMPVCSGDALPGQPLSWWFNIYLISDDWLAENGLVLPLDVTGIDELRSEYGLDYVQAQDGRLPLADNANASTIYVFSSTLLVDDPLGVMRSMGSFNAVGYLPVLELGVDSLFISVDSAEPGLAQEYVEFIAAQSDIPADLMTEAQRLPALDAAAIRTLGFDSPGSLATLRAVTTLSAYARLVN